MKTQRHGHKPKKNGSNAFESFTLCVRRKKMNKSLNLFFQKLGVYTLLTLFISLTHCGLLNSGSKSDPDSKPPIADVDPISGSVEGLPLSAKGLAIITSKDNISELAVVPVENGKFSYTPKSNGEYLVKLEVPGYSTRSAVSTSAGSEVSIQAEEIQVSENTYYYRWHEDQSVSGLEYSSAIIEPIKVEILWKRAGIG